MLRILSHIIVHEGQRHKLAVAEFADDFSSVRVFPFREETADTAFVEGEIVVIKADGKFFAEKNGRKLVF